MQACYDILRISGRGTFAVICSPRESEQILCRTPDGQEY